MATTIIPSRKVVTCDFCGCETHTRLDWDGRRRRDGVLTLESVVLDRVGDACASDHKTYDLCDQCLVDFTEEIAKKVEDAKKKA